MAKKLKIRLYKDGSVSMETVGIKGKSCLDYIPFFEKIANVKILKEEKTKEFYETDVSSDASSSINSDMD